MIAEGVGNKEIAERLQLGEKTVRNYVSRVYRKLAVHSRAQIAAYCVRTPRSHGRRMPTTCAGRPVARESEPCRGSLSEQPLDLRASVKAIWWRRRLVGALAAIGLARRARVRRRPSPHAQCGGLGAPASDQPDLVGHADARREHRDRHRHEQSGPVRGGQVGVAADRTRQAQAPGGRHRPEPGRLADPGRSLDRPATRSASPMPSPATTSSTSPPPSSTSTRPHWPGSQHESSQLTQQIQGLQTQINTVSARIRTEGASSSAGQQDSSLLGIAEQRTTTGVTPARQRQQPGRHRPAVGRRGRPGHPHPAEGHHRRHDVELHGGAGGVIGPRARAPGRRPARTGALPPRSPSAPTRRDRCRHRRAGARLGRGQPASGPRRIGPAFSRATTPLRSTSGTCAGCCNDLQPGEPVEGIGDPGAVVRGDAAAVAAGPQLAVFAEELG